MILLCFLVVLGKMFVLLLVLFVLISLVVIVSGDVARCLGKFLFSF